MKGGALMSVSYDRLAERIDDLIFELSLINSELNELRKRICLLEKSLNNLIKINKKVDVSKL